MRRIWVEAEKCLGCKSCELACAVTRSSQSGTLLGAALEKTRPSANVTVVGDRERSFPLQCRHCESARCIDACPSGAMQRDEKTGLTSINHAVCCGCWMCVMSCPMGVVRPSSAHKVAHKCDACATMQTSACVSACPTGALRSCTEDEYAALLAAKKTAFVSLLDGYAAAQQR